MNFTSEQQEAINSFGLGTPMKAIAFAGAGKTSTLVGMAKCTPRRGLYLAFNKAIQMDARSKFPPTVTCLTAHSMAFRHVAQMGYEEKKLTDRAWSRNFKFDRPESKAALRDVFQVTAFKSFVADTVARFCQSADDVITMKHVPQIPKGEKAVKLRVTEEDRVPAMVCAREIWDRMTDESDPLPMGHDGYVKVWAMRALQFNFDYFLADEAQDLNPVLIKVMLNQKIPGVPVGDTHQQIYEWRGARDALPMFPGVERHLTQSFRFGPAIAGVADGLLKAMGEERTLRGIDVPDRVSHAAPAWEFMDAVLCRSNSGVINATLDAGASERAAYVQGGVRPIVEMVQDVQRLQGGEQARTADLFPFADWPSVVEFSQSPEGGGFRVLCSLVKNYGVDELLKILDSVLETPKPGCITISTTHKAKGLEWDMVTLGADFDNAMKGKDGEELEISLADRRLFYVAATRAKRFLNVNEETVKAFSKPIGESDDI